ncbi:MAG: hypothetical protein ACFBSG_15525 [Leptolyngbyaceae cyanobacterium]
MLPVVTAVSVLPLNSQVLLGHNQETYQRLQTAVQSTPPHRFCLAICDDLSLQRQLAATLEESLQHTGAIAPTQFLLNAEQPNLPLQLANWATQRPGNQGTLLQVLGIEQLTYRGSDTQYQFLRSLHQLWPAWQQLHCSLLLWVPRPWLRQIRREVPHLGQTVFEFISEPTPISTLTPQPTYEASFSPVRRWQFLGQAEAIAAATDSPANDAAASLAAASLDPAEAPSEPTDTTEADLPAISETLWSELQADLTQFEATRLETDVAAFDSTQRQRDALDLSESGNTALTDLATLSSQQRAHWQVAFDLRDRVQAGAASAPLLETAIRAYERLQPLRISTPQRTEVLNDLGSLYWLWAQQAETVDIYWQRLLDSSERYEAALSPISSGTDTRVLNRLHSNLGSVYSLLAAHQTPTHYLGKAVRAFHRALQYVSTETAAEEYATLQTHLGTVYWSLSQYSQEATYLHRAITAYQEALNQTLPQQVPQIYAQLQNNLGIALWSLSRHERPIFLLERAVEAYRTTLAYRTLETDPIGYAATHNNLGTAYWDLGGQYEADTAAQQQAWRQAIAAYETAITAAEQVPAAELGFDLWATHHSVGVVYDQLAIALAPEAQAQEPLLLAALPHYVTALTGWQATATTTADVAFQALLRNLQLQARYLGIETQQRSLSQIPAAWLPDLWRKL